MSIHSVREREIDGALCLEVKVRVIGRSPISYIYELQDDCPVAAFKIVEGHRRKAPVHEFLLHARELDEDYGYTAHFSDDPGQYRGGLPAQEVEA